MRLLTALSEWEAVDRVLAGRLHLLMYLSPAQRAAYASEWPDVPASTLPNLAAAREFVAGSSRSNAAAQALTPWYRHVGLVQVNLPAKGTLAHELRATVLDHLGPGQWWQFEFAQQAVTGVASRLCELADRMLADDQTHPRPLGHVGP